MNILGIFKAKVKTTEPKPVKFDAELAECLRLAVPEDRWDVRVRPHSDDLPMPAPVCGTGVVSLKLRFIQERFARNCQISDRARELYRGMPVDGIKTLDGKEFRSPAGGFTIQKPDHGLLIARISTQCLLEIEARADVGRIEMLYSEDNRQLYEKLQAKSAQDAPRANIIP